MENVGVENLRLESAFDAETPKDENHSWFAITMENAASAWVRQVTFQHFAGSAVAVYESCKRVTVEDFTQPTPTAKTILDAYPNFCVLLDKEKTDGLGTLTWPSIIKSVLVVVDGMPSSI